MKISIVQMEVYYKDKSRNIAQVSELLAKSDVVGDMVLLPELFSTGYIFNVAEEIHELSEDYADSGTIESLRLLADKYNTLIVAGIAEEGSGHFYNSVAVIDKNGLKHKYRKISQTNIDKKYFSRGNSLLTFQHRGLAFGVAICFDLWFPEIIRGYADVGVDVLLHPANFGGDQSLKIARARAIENSMYVVTCNRIGEDVTKDLSGTYCGNSQVCTPAGEILLQFGSDSAIKIVDLNHLDAVSKRVIGVDLTEEIKTINDQLNHS